jgi:hypothetical protein
MKKILARVRDAQQLDSIRKIAAGMDCAVVPLQASDADRCLCEILEIDAGILKRTPGRHAPVLWNMPDLLVFFAFENAALDAFLAEYRAAGLPPAALKAMVTPYNLTWSVYELTEELQREHESFAR